ncbi:VOC family protein [Nitratireductor luteus]|uniref:VOC family protein n=1 Tax=Nitratireductor luteus TaxID=2976980 RepID=UPI002240CF3E|nr:VOC family protein [Nitratireductor luteus]
MSAMEQTQEVPETKGGVVAYLSVDGAAKAAEFYAKAFGAEQVFAYPPDEKGRTMHVHLYVNGSSVMLSDFYPEHGHAFEKPQGFTMHLIVDDIDAWWERVSNTEGMTVELPLQKMFWGDRYATLRDPFGVLWALVGK